MTVQVPFPIPSHGFALNSKLRVNLDFIVAQFNQFNTGTATWDNVSIGTANSLTGTLTFYNASNAYYTTFQAGVATGSTTYTLPVADGSASTFLQTNGSGTLSWAPAIADGLGGYLAMYDATIGSPSSNLQAYKLFNSQYFRVAIADQGSLSSTRTYTIPNTGANTASFIMSEGSQSINGNFEALAPFYIKASKFRLTTDVTMEVSLASGGVGYSLTWPSTQGGANEVLANNGSGTLSWTAVSAISGAASVALDNLASVAINTALISDTDNTDDLGTSAKQWKTIYARTLNLGKSGANGDLVLYPSTASKGFLDIFASDNAGAFNLLITNASLAASRTYTMPDAGASANFVMSEGTATINGTKTFGSTIVGTTDGNALKALSNLASVAINTTLVSDTDDTDNLGTTSIGWSKIYMNDGAVGTPSFTFSDDPDNGAYRIGTNNWGLTAGGTKCVDIKAAGTSVIGTNTNDSAAASYIGEYIESLVSSPTNTGATNVAYNVTSISLTAGDWDVSGIIDFFRNGATFTSVDLYTAISPTSGNSFSGETNGVNANEFSVAAALLTFSQITLTIPTFRVSLSGTTTYYLKGYVNAYTAGQPTNAARISARRVR